LALSIGVEREVLAREGEAMCPQPSDRHNPIAYERGRNLRRPLSPTEAILWRELRGRRFAGFKFRRQQPVGPYIADFFYAGVNLIVELDGDSHVGQEVKDARRQAYLEAAGYRVQRFWNTELYDNLDGVMEAIWTACSDPAGRPPPKG